MALSALTVWEVRTTGSDLNGGGFVAGAAGTDYSVASDSPQVTFDGSTITATTAGVGDTITLVGVAGAAAHVGNIVQIASGTNFTAGFYQIIAQTASTWQFDRNCTSGAGAAMVGRMGGPLLTVGKIATVAVGSNKIWVKSGTYSESSISFTAASVTPSSTVAPTTLIGYASTRGDIYPGSANRASRPVLQHSSTTGKLTMSGNGWFVANLVFEKTAGTYSSAITGAGGTWVVNCTVNDFTTNGIFLTSGGFVAFCDVFDGAGASCKGINMTSSGVVEDCYIHDITGGATASGAIIATSDLRASRNIIDTITGSTSDGIQVTGAVVATNNSIYNVGRDGIRLGTSISTSLVKGNIIEAWGGYAINQPTDGWPAGWRWDGNAFYNSPAGTGVRNNLDDTDGINGSGSYTNVFDKTLTVSPFTSAAAGDFTLNGTAGGGAECRLTGPYTIFPGLSSTSYVDMGAIQHQDTGGGGGGGAFMFIPIE